MSSAGPACLALLLVPVLGGCALFAPTSPAPLYREAVATFDDPVKAFETHLSGFIGKLRNCRAYRRGSKGAVWRSFAAKPEIATLSMPPAARAAGSPDPRRAASVHADPPSCA